MRIDRRRLAGLFLSSVLAVLTALLLLGAGQAPSDEVDIRGAVRPAAQVVGGDGYWLVGGDGEIFEFGDAEFFGSAADEDLAEPIVGMAASPTGGGYWLVGGDGEVFEHGDAEFHGSTGAIELNRPIVGMAATPTGMGYWLVATDGGIFAFGDARFFGSTGAIALNKPIVGMAATPTGKGYWLVASDGGLFAFGDARFFGSTGSIRLNKPVVGMAATATSQGYWLVASDGGIFAFGDARFFGSTGGISLNSPIVGMAPSASGNGYWLTAEDGGIFAFGDAEFHGSTGGEELDAPIVGMVPTPAFFVNEFPDLAVTGGPADNGRTNDSTPTFKGTASDGDGTVSAVYAAIDGGDFSISRVACTGCGTANATWSFTSGTLSAGTHTVEFAAVDDTDFASEIVKRTFTVDTTKPTVTVAKKTGQADPAKTGPINYTVTFSESVTGFTASDVTLGGTSGGTKSAVVTGSGKTYNVAVSGMTSSSAAGNTVTVKVPAGAAKDAAGNTNTASNTRSVVYDTVAPTVTVEQKGDQEDPSDEGTIDYTVQFSETVTGFATGDVTVSGSAGGTKTAAVTAVDGDTYNVAVTGMTTDGTVLASVAAGKATDTAGNANTASTSTDNTVTRDATAPTVTVEQKGDQEDPSDESTIDFVVQFSETVTGFATGDVTVSGTAGGTKTATVTAVDGDTYDVAVTGTTGPGTVVASVAAAKATDAAGNDNAASTSTDNSVEYDNTDPTVTVEQKGDQEDPTDEGAVDFVVQFSETVTGFATGDASFAGSTVTGTLTGTVTAVDGDTYNLAVTGATGDGLVVASVAAGKAVDAAGNDNAASASTDNVVTRDTAAPSFDSIDAGTGSTTVDAAFNELMLCSSIQPSDFTATVAGNPTTVTAVNCDAPSDNTVQLTLATGPTPTDAVSVTLVGTVTDRAGNPAATPTTHSETPLNAAPTLTVTDGPGDATSTSDPTPTYEGLAADADGTVAAVQVSVDDGPFSTSGVTLTAPNWEFTPTTALSQGAHTIDFVAVDDDGTSSSIVTRTVTVDPTPPTVTIAKAGAQEDPTDEGSIEFVVQFSETVTGFDDGDIDLSGTASPATADVTAVDGDTYDVAVSGMASDGTVTADVDAGKAVDAAGNGNEAAPAAATVTYDTTGPTVTVEKANGQSDPAKDSPIQFTAQFSETVTGFTDGDVTLGGSSGGTKAATVTAVDGDTYTISVSGMTDGTVTASLDAAVVTDTAGNGNAVSTSADNSVLYDATRPTVTVAKKTGQADPTSSTPVEFTATFSEDVVGFTDDDVDIDGTAEDKTVTVTGGPTVFTIAVGGMTTDGTVIVTVPEESATDAAGNENLAAATTVTVTYDTTDPTVTIVLAGGQSTPTNEAALDYFVEFSEPVTGFTNGDVTVSGTAGGTKTVTVTQLNPSEYDVAVTGMTSDGTVVVDVGAGKATDAAGNGNEAAPTAATITYDTSSPSVTVEQAGDQDDPTNDSPIDFTAQFTETVVGFAAGDVTLGGTAGGTTSVGVTAVDGDTYTISVTGMTDGTVTASLGAGVVTDNAGNANPASTSADNVVTYDTTSATFDSVQVTAGSSDVVAVFSEPLDCAGSVMTADFLVTVASLPRTISSTRCPGDPDNTVVLTLSSAVGDGQAVSVTLVTSVADPAGNTTMGPTMHSGTPPTVSITGGPADAGSTNDTTPTYSGTAADGAGNVASVEASVDGGAFSTTGVACTDCGTAAATWSFTPGSALSSGAHTVAFRAVDDGGSRSAAASRSVTIDGAAPTVTVEQAGGQVDPTNAGPIEFTVTFSEPVTGFTAGDVTLGGTSGGTKAASITAGADGEDVYTVEVTGMTDGTVTASLLAGVASDLAGNPSEASTSDDNSVLYDTAGPTVTVNQKAGQPDPSNTSPVAFTVVFSDPVSGFAAGDVTLGGSAAGTKTATVTGSGTTYNVAVSGMTGSGTVTASVPAAAANDAAGNPSAASTSTDNTITYDTTVPTVTITQKTGQADPTNDSPVEFTAVFSEAVFGFTGGDVSFGGTSDTSAATVTVTGSGTTYNVAVAGMGDGTVVASIPAGKANDAAGNGNQGSTSTDNEIVYDTTGPTPTIAVDDDQEDPTDESTIDFSVTFSEALATPADFTGADITLGGTSGGTKTATVTDSGDGTTFAVQVQGMTSNGTVTAQVAASAADDAAENATQASGTVSVTFDNQAPTLDGIAPLAGGGTVIATFSEPLDCDEVEATDFEASIASATPTTRVVTTATCTGPSDATVELALALTTLASGNAVSVTVGAGDVQDPAGNTLAADTTVTNTVPTVSVTADPTNNGFTNDTTPTYGGSATDAGAQGATIAAVQVAVDGGAFSTTGVTGTGTWSFTPAPALAEGAHTLDFRAVDDMGGISGTATRNVTIDITGPTVTIDKKSGQADPTNTAPVLFTVVFSESVSTFDNTDVTLTGSPAGATASVTGSGTTYEVSVSGMTADGTVTASIAAGAAPDDAGNNNAASTSTDNTVGYDATAPTVTVAKKTGQADPTNATPIEFTATFSEATTGFTASDVDVEGTAEDKTATVTGGPTVFNIAVSGMTTDGTVIVTVPEDAGTDAAGNDNTAAATTVTVTYDTTDPTVTLEKKTGQADSTKTAPVLFTVVFTESVADFTASDVTLTGSPAGATASVTGSGTTYEVSVSGMTADGTVTASLAANVAHDAAGNGNEASTSTDNTVVYDTTAPTVGIAKESTQEDPTDESAVDFTVTFSEAIDPTTFTAADLTTGGTATPATRTVTITDSGDATSFNVAVSGLTAATAGTVTASVNANAAKDPAGNDSSASPSTASVDYDDVAPTFDSIAPTGDESTVTAVFSEPLRCSTVATTDFVVTVNALPRTVSAVACTDPVDDTVVLTLSGAALAGGDAVSVTLLNATLAGVEDEAGNTNGATSTTMTNTVPTITVTSTTPADGATTQDTTPTYSGDADDDDGTVDAVEASVDGGAFSTSGVTTTPDGGDTNWSFTPATGLADGAHTIVFRVTDDHDGTMVVTRTVTIDTTGPTFQSITPVRDDTTVTATFDEPVLCSTVTDTDFTATINGTAVTVNSVTCSGTSDNTIGVVLASAPSNGQTVAVTLASAVTDPSGNTSATGTTRSANAS